MKVVVFCHSLISDWNHGNAHFLRGIVTELLARGHDVAVFEPADAWSFANLLAEAGPAAVAGFRRAYPQLSSRRVNLKRLDLDEALDGADVVLVHEWNERHLVERVGRHRTRARYVLLFHDTHHRSVSDEAAMQAYDLQHYDGVLAFGEVIRQRYVRLGWARRAFTWHEAADIRVFHPHGVHRWHDDPNAAAEPSQRDLVWIGNWGDDERSEEIRQYLIEPVRGLRLRSRVHGVRYPEPALAELRAAGVEFAGWLPNYRVPEAFGEASVTLHIPRRPYVAALPGVPTIRVFEALACGIPLMSCWWDDVEGLFEPGTDFAVVRTPEAMRQALEEVRHDPAAACERAASGLRRVRARHTCAHRVDELLGIVDGIRFGSSAEVIRA